MTGPEEDIGSIPGEPRDGATAYRDALAWLYGLQIYGIKLGLENMLRLCEALDVDLQSGATRKFVHVAGTNGKGSVCALIGAICCAAGRRTGIYTSPHLVSFRERIRLGPNFIPERDVVDLVGRIRTMAAAWEHSPTFFEVTTAMALAWFQRQRAEWVILETGLGGRLDATNVVTPVVSVLTPIGFDHQQHLGDTLAAIAGEKAGIIKPGVPVISAPQPPEAEEVFQAVAEERGASIKFLQKPITDSWTLALTGSHQRMNAAVAFASLISGGLRPDPRDVGQAFARVEWPGRFQSVWEGRLILDGAHNAAAAQRLVQTWREEFGEEKATLVLGVLRDKDVRAVCAPLLEIAQRVICAPVRSPRALDPNDLADIVRGMTSVPCTTVDKLSAALPQARQHEERALLAGSLFLVGEALVELGLVTGAHEWSAQ